MADRNIGTTVRYVKHVTREGMELFVPASDFVSIGSLPPIIDPWTTDDITQQFPLGTELYYGQGKMKRVFEYTLMGAAGVGIMLL